MTEQLQREEIARACGWIHGTHKDLGYTEAFSKIWLPPDKKYGYENPPNYLNDLNAMHDAESYMLDKMAVGLWSHYISNLRKKCGGEHPAHATAKQRADAFIKTIRKYKWAKV